MPDDKSFLWTYLKRGIGYALTSLLALGSGYIISAKAGFFLEYKLAAIPFLLSLPFFANYAICFKYAGNFSAGMKTYGSERDISIIFAVCLAVVSALFYILCGFGTKHTPPFLLLISLILYGILFYGYGFYLFIRYVARRETPLMRHQLVWPAVLSIAVSMYYGLFLNDFANPNKFPDSRPIAFYVPLLSLIAYFFFTEFFQLSKRIFLKLSLFLIFALIAVLAMITKFNLVDNSISSYAYAMIFCLASAAYLAIFEAWRICSYIANQKTTIDKTQERISLLKLLFKLKSRLYPTISVNCSPIQRYFFATLFAFILTGVFIPFIYIFSDYGLILLVSFFLHALISISFWNVYGYDLIYLRMKNWVFLKTLFGFIFLSILVADSWYNFQPDRVLDIHSISALSFFSNLAAGLSLYYLLHSFLDYIPRYRNEGLVPFLLNRRTHIRLGVLFSLIFYWAIFVLQYASEESPLLEKSSYSMLVYLIIVLLAVAAEIGTQILDRLETDKTASSLPQEALGKTRTNGDTHVNCVYICYQKLLGLMQTTRIVTSLIVCISVFLPAMTHGYALLPALLSSLPFFLSAMGGFALNDYFDQSRDKLNRPRRAIPSGRLGPNTVLSLGIILLVGASITAFNNAKAVIEICLYALVIAGVIIYNLIVKWIPYVKVLITALISTIPIIYVVVMFSIPPVFYYLIFSSVIFISGRELLMDIVDIEGDKASQIRTIPMLLGEKATMKLAFALQILSLALLAPIFNIHQTGMKILCLTLLALLEILVLWGWIIGSRNLQRRLISILLVPMLFGVLMVSFS